MISSREDKDNILLFFKVLKQFAGSIHPQWFMSDDTEQYFTAWSDIFGSSQTKKILCAWHIDRAWRKALNQHIPFQDDRVQIYHQLRMLLTETNESEFRVMLQTFLTYSEKYHFNFYKYFSTYYCKRVEQWASCYRCHTQVNTNMFVESFHRVLKIKYLHHKRNQRVDTLLVTLLKISRDKAFGRLLKLEKGKNTHRISEINRRHKCAEKMTMDNAYSILTVEQDMEWTVQSQSDQSVIYIIRRQSEPCTCHVRCKLCNICAHSFTCTCLDSILRSTICKHIHLVVIKNEINSTGSGSEENSQEILDAHKAILADTNPANQLIKSNSLKSLKNSIYSVTSKIQLFVQDCDNHETLKLLQKRLESDIALVEALDTSSTKDTKMASLIPKETCAPNTNVPAIYSTRKRKNTTTNPLSKPSHTELENQRKKLKTEHPMFCGVCFQQNDFNNNSTINWIQCENCNMWIHDKCTLNNNALDNYICHFCLK